MSPFGYKQRSKCFHIGRETYGTALAQSIFSI